MAIVRARMTVRNRIRRLMKNLPAAMSARSVKAEVGELLVRRIKKRFKQGVDSNGKRWEKKADKNRTPATLTKSGRLYKSIDLAKGAAGGTFIVSKGGFRIQADATNPRDGFSYGREHQLGLNNMPVREFLGVSDSDVRAVSSKLKRMIDKTVGV
jgi:phage gpG-like protein